jgi:hypothetical protein
MPATRTARPLFIYDGECKFCTYVKRRWQKITGTVPPSFDLIAWLFLRGIGLIYLAAFVSFGVQALGLIGSHGILPLPVFLHAIRIHLGSAGAWEFPMVFWFDASDRTIEAVCWGGAALSLLLVFNILPRVNLVALYVLYLSLFYAGQVFMTFQWDLELLEVGFLAFILSVTQKPGIWLLRWLIFRFMFLSGSVKLLSGDPNWADLSALSYHFQTQPLPTPLAWYAHHLPAEFLTVSTVATFIIELGLPFLIFMPRRLRFVAAFGFLFLEFLILLTGNYNFFNFLTMLICLALFDDAALRSVLPKKCVRFIEKRHRDIRPNKLATGTVGVIAALIVFIGGAQICAVYGHEPPAPARWIAEQIMPLHIVNSYGLFAVMTTSRPEIVIEGSDDGAHWEEYVFKYQPGDVMKPPLWNIPHQPRLDWQMWFAALGTRDENPWFTQLLERLLEGEPQVTALFAVNPFAPPRHPPRYVRAIIYDYRFSTPQERKHAGAWWVRQPEGVYFPPASLKAPG